MKKIVLPLIILSVAFKANSQDTSLHKSAVAVCDCLSKSKLDNSTPQQLQQVFLQCILTSAPDLVTKMMGSGQDNMQAAQETATNLALEMMKNGCPAFTKIAESMAMSSGDSNDVDMNTSPSINITAKPQAIESVNGVVTKVEERDFIYLTVKATTGRELEFIYYNYVPGSDEWIKDPSTKLKNKNISLSYTETEVYQPKFKQFMNVREIKTLTIK